MSKCIIDYDNRPDTIIPIVHFSKFYFDIKAWKYFVYGAF